MNNTVRIRINGTEYFNLELDNFIHFKWGDTVEMWYKEIHFPMITIGVTGVYNVLLTDRGITLKRVLS